MGFAMECVGMVFMGKMANVTSVALDVISVMMKDVFSVIMGIC